MAFSRASTPKRRKQMPGVLAVYTAADLAAYGPHKCALDFKHARRLADEAAGPQVARLGQGALRRRPGGLRDRRDLGAGEGRGRGGRARHRAAAGRDAARARRRSPARRSSTTTCRTTCCLDFLWGEPEKVAEAFAKAAHVTKLTSEKYAESWSRRWSRARRLCKFDGERWTLTVPGQGVCAQKNQLADILGVTPDKVRILTLQRRRLVRHEGARSIRSTSASRTRRASSGGR